MVWVPQIETSLELASGWAGVQVTLQDPGMVFPNGLKLHGSTQIMLLPDTIGPGEPGRAKVRLWVVSRQLFQRLSGILKRLDCEEGDFERGDFAHCFSTSVTSYMGCRLPWLEDWLDPGQVDSFMGRDLALCQTEEQFDKYISLTKELLKADETRKGLSSLRSCRRK